MNRTLKTLFSLDAMSQIYLKLLNHTHPSLHTAQRKKRHARTIKQGILRTIYPPGIQLIINCKHYWVDTIWMQQYLKFDM